MADMKLKNCPFCNKLPILEKFPVPIEHCYSGYLWTVVSGCGVQMQGYGDKDATTNKWNTRTSDSTIEAQEAEIKRLRDCLQEFVDFELPFTESRINLAQFMSRKLVEENSLRLAELVGKAQAAIAKAEGK